MIYALVKNGQVFNVISASAEFISSDHGLGYDHAVDVSGLTPRPGVGWLYDGQSWQTPQAVQLTLDQIIDNSLSAAALFGTSTMNNFKRANVKAGITQAGKTQLIADAAHDLYHYLVTGSLYAAITECDTLMASPDLANWAPYITADTLKVYKNQIQTYLGLALT